MKVTAKASLPPAFLPKLSSQTLNPSPHSDLPPNRSSPKLPRRRRLFNPPSTSRRKAAPPSGKRSRQETPLLKWKIEEGQGCVGIEEEDDSVADDGRRRGRSGRYAAVSARKLAAGLWRLQLPEVDGSGGWKRSDERLGFQPASVSHVGLPFAYHRSGKEYGSEVKDQVQSSDSFIGTKNGFLSKNTSSAMEGATKWDPVCLKVADEIDQIHSHMKHLDPQASAVPMVSALESELEQARAHIEELEAERRSSKKKMEHFLKKVSEERAAWRSREHEKVRAFIEDMKDEVKRERKNRQRMEIVHSKLVNELADAKLAAKRFKQDYEKERKARELIEEVCDELANEIGEEKAEVEALKRESLKVREEVEEERKMLQMAEVWREERVQMKLVDAKVAVEEKYSQMNKLVADLEAFLRSKNAISNVKEMKEAETLRQAAASVNIQEVKDFTYEPPNPDDIFSIFEDVNFGESNEREIEPCVAYSHSPASHASRIRTVSPEVNMHNKGNTWRHSNAFTEQNGEIEEDESGWETVSHLEDQGSCYSHEGDAMSVNKGYRHSNISGSGTEWDDNAGNETPISEVCSVVTKRQAKKVASIAKLWRSGPNNGDKYKIMSLEGLKGRISNARLSNGSMMSPDRVSGKGGVSPPDYTGQWSSPELGNPHINRGMKGCIEWPRNAQKNSLKAKLMEARMESQKVQLRHVLKHKI